jgi:hypothetical protein
MVYPEIMAIFRSSRNRAGYVNAYMIRSKKARLPLGEAGWIGRWRDSFEVPNILRGSVHVQECGSGYRGNT